VEGFCICKFVGFDLPSIVLLRTQVELHLWSEVVGQVSEKAFSEGQ